jgi:DNA-binding NarL/FixJ family response regulator
LTLGIRNHAAYAYRGLADVYIRRSGAGDAEPATQRRRLPEAQLKVLQLLVDEPNGLTIDEIAERLDTPLTAASKRTMRLKELLGDDLKATREGNARRYSLKRV